MCFYYGVASVDISCLVFQRYELKAHFIPYLPENYLTFLGFLNSISLGFYWD